MSKGSDRGETPDAEELASAVEAACGDPPVYSADFRLITEEGEVLGATDAARRLRDRGPNPVLAAVMGELPEGGYRLIYERIASVTRFGESWPSPAASVVCLDSELVVIERRDYGGFVRERRRQSPAP